MKPWHIALVLGLVVLVALACLWWVPTSTTAGAVATAAALGATEAARREREARRREVDALAEVPDLDGELDAVAMDVADSTLDELLDADPGARRL